jgi:hypothetical protein
MRNGNLSEQLLNFIQSVRNHPDSETNMTVLQLRLVCRNQRLTEYPDWPPQDLDCIEQEIACYEDEAPLEHVISGQARPRRAPDSGWLNSPSPFSWS